jgi:hypothetical protein
MKAATALIRSVIALLPAAMFAAQTGASLPTFEDYRVRQIFQGKPAAPVLDTAVARRYRTRIKDGVEKGWGVYDEQPPRGRERPGPNFAGHYIVIQWGCGSPCLQMAIADAETGVILLPPIAADGKGFILPLLTLGNSVPGVAEIHYRLDSELMVIRATPVQSREHPSFEYYFVLSQGRWELLRRIRLSNDIHLGGDDK